MNLLQELASKIVDEKNIEQLSLSLKEKGFSIVTLNGSFDLLHAGHLHILSEAAKQGDILMILLNSDRSIKNYKSSQRPIIPLKYRLDMIAALECVDYVSSFDEVNPINILAKIKPDIHVNGAEYGYQCVEAEIVKQFGGKIYLVDKVEGLSTSQIINKIQTL